MKNADDIKFALEVQENMIIPKEVSDGVGDIILWKSIEKTAANAILDPKNPDYVKPGTETRYCAKAGDFWPGEDGRNMKTYCKEPLVPGTDSHGKPLPNGAKDIYDICIKCLPPPGSGIFESSCA